MSRTQPTVARCRATRRIADHPGEVANQKNDRVSEILKMFQLAQQDRVPQVQIGSGRIEARLHPQRLARGERAFELRAQFGFFDDLRRALLDVCQLFVNRWKVSHVVVIITTLFLESRASSPGHDDAGARGDGRDARRYADSQGYPPR